MSVSPQLMLAILAMDAYNRGYNAGIIGVNGNAQTGLGLIGQIGNATIGGNSTNLGAGRDIAASFYAQSYTYNGRTIISYRGTDVLPTLQGGTGGWIDVSQWSSIAGYYDRQQQLLAADFYRSVAAANPSANIQLTGHSLGGALAGFVGAIYGRQATLYDNISFERAVQNLTTPVTLLSYLTGANEPTARLAAQQYYFGSGALPTVSFPNNGTTTTYLTFEVAGATRFAQETPQTAVSFGNSGLSVVQLHTQALLVVSMFGNGLADKSWLSVTNLIGPALFDNQIGKALGLTKNTTGFLDEGPQALTAIAYSAIDEGTRVFGDKGIEALFNDANKLGKIVGASQTTGVLKLTAVQQALAKIIVQYAGDVALSKQVASSFLSGALTEEANRLHIQFDPTQWEATRFNPDPGFNILGRNDLVKALITEYRPGALSVEEIADFKFRREVAYQTYQNVVDSITRATLATTDAPLAADATGAAVNITGGAGAVLLAGAGGKDTLTGGAGDDLILGEGGNDVLRGGAGNDVILGGSGQDTIQGGRGYDTMSGGAGLDTIDYSDVADGVVIRISLGDYGTGNSTGTRSLWVDIGAQGEERDTIFQFERIFLGGGADRLKFDEADLKKIYDLRKTLTIDFGTDKPDAPTGPALRGLSTPQPVSHGDSLDFSSVTNGLLINLRDGDDQFVTNIEGGLPTRLGYNGVGLPTGTFSAIKFLNTMLKELNSPTDLSTYGGDNWLDVEDVESTWGTNASDVIIGADRIGEWVTDEPTPENPNPQPVFVIDTAFAGYDLIGNGGNDTILVYNGSAQQVTYHLIDGGAGNDVIVVRDFGNQFYTDTATGQITRSEIRGGDGNDVIFSIGAGIGGDVIGGAGEDFLFNTAYKGRIWGDSVDGTGARSKDVFWWSSGAFIMDAGKEDLLQMFGVPLTGGTNIFMGLIAAGDGSLAQDWLMPWVYYGYTKSGQLIVHSTLSGMVNGGGLRAGSNLLATSMIVENYHFGGLKDGNILGVPTRGDLNMTFRLAVPKGTEGAVEIRLFYAVFGQLASYANAVQDFAKGLSWKYRDDPLILDLDGDGIETSSVSQSSAFFDMDGDGFAEKTAWVDADDGLLVMDRDGDGRITDVNELFGGPGRSANDNVSLQEKRAS
jgi:RTX calcium-binding nonapeptide repeat (4 copies)/Lipase (class 3)